MKKAILLLLAAGAAVLGVFRDSPGIGEWLRRASDIPTNAFLLGTSGFEREGVDPAKAA